MVETRRATRPAPEVESWFRIFAESTSAALVAYRQNRPLYANRAAEALTGYRLEEILALDDLRKLIAPEDRETCCWSADRDDDDGRLHARLLPKHGAPRWVEISSSKIHLLGEPARLATVIDVTRHQRVEEALSRQKELAQVTLASIGDGVIRTDAEGRIDYMNPVAESLTGWALDEAAGREVADAYEVVNEATQRRRRDPVALCLAEKRTVVLPGLFTLRSRRGDDYTIRDSVAPLLSSDELVGTVLVFRDLTQVRGLERRMVYLESHDTLTGLLNRQEFDIYLEAALESARDQGVEHALLYLDLLGFKLINDGYGHTAGDELLRRVADLLQSDVAQRGILGRVGGDEFSLLLENHDRFAALDVARAIQRTFRDFRFSWGGQHFDVDLSIGVVPIGAASESVTQILKAADAACYLARQKGRNRIHTYRVDDASIAERYGRLHWVQRIRSALAKDRFRLYQQKIRPLKDNGKGFREILLRMIDESGEPIPPNAFIPIAESHDLAPSIDRWVVRKTLEHLAHDDAFEGRVSINLSGQSLGEETFLEDVTGYIEASGIAPERIYFEITETAAVAHMTRALHFLRALKELGCHFILDDFGSGFSSFTYLKNLPVDILKIDGEFVRSIETDPIHRAMVASINQIGQVMGLKTIAEWVETEATYDILSDLGVDYVQGFWIHKPEALR